jgi:hypothetical protein
VVLVVDEVTVRAGAVVVVVVVDVEVDVDADVALLWTVFSIVVVFAPELLLLPMRNPIPPPMIRASTTASAAKALPTPRAGRKSKPQLGQTPASPGTGA